MHIPQSCGMEWVTEQIAAVSIKLGQIQIEINKEWPASKTLLRPTTAVSMFVP